VIDLTIFAVSSSEQSLSIGPSFSGQNVQIDILPSDSSNIVNLGSKGVIPVAILSTASFDATQVAPLSAKFGPDGANDVKGKGDVKDVNKDGKPDLILHFNTKETGIVCGATAASLIGKTLNGEDIQGVDSIVTAGCK